MPAYRSRTTTHGRNMAGARALWRATGMKDGDFGKPIIAIVNSFTQFVPGHVHLKDMGQLVAREIEAAGGVAKEFNTIAVDDGIAMGHDGMLYSLPSRELIADSVEYMVNAHCADAMVCISNCDKITPGMLMAAMRLNIPDGLRLRRADGGGQGRCSQGKELRRSIWSMPWSPPPTTGISDEDVSGYRALGLPDLRLLLRHVHRQLDELPDRGAGPGAARQRLDAGDPCRPQAAVPRGRAPRRRHWPSAITSRTTRPCCRAPSPASRPSRTPWRSTSPWAARPTPCCTCWPPRMRPSVDFTMNDIDRLSRRVPVLCKVAPAMADVHMEDVHRAGGIMAILGELDRAGLIHRDLPTVHRRRPGRGARPLGHRAAAPTTPCAASSALRRAACRPRPPSARTAAATSSISTARRAASAAPGTPTRKDGGLAVLYGNIAADGCIVKTAGVDESILELHRPGARLREPGRGGQRHSRRQDRGRRRGGHPLRRPAGRPGHAGNALSDQLPEIEGARQGLRAGHRRPLLRRHLGPVHRPRLAGSGRRRRHRPGREGDTIEIDIPNRSIELAVDEAELERRRAAQDAAGWRPAEPRKRQVTTALRAYAAFATSADKGAVRKAPGVGGR